MAPERVPKRLEQARPYVEAFRAICVEHRLRPVEAALRFALESSADYVVFGVENMTQLGEDLAIAAAPPSPGWLSLKDSLDTVLHDLPEAVVVPSLWAKE
jgi:aryl-alcohol dehydrogenase-like predicted oxidoreductase